MTGRVDREVDRYLEVVRRIREVAPEAASPPGLVLWSAWQIRNGQWPDAAAWIGTVEQVLDRLEAAGRRSHEQTGEDVTVFIAGISEEERRRWSAALARGHLDDQDDQEEPT